MKLEVGDIIMYKIYMHIGITRVVLHEGELCMEGNFMSGDNTKIDSFLKNSHNRIEKMSLVDVYKFCKENGWNTGRYIAKFGKKL